MIEPTAPSSSPRHSSEPSEVAHTPPSGFSRLSLSALIVIVAIALATAVCGWRISQYAPLQRTNGGAGTGLASQSGNARATYAWRGAVHAHSTLSDGAGSVEDVVRAAQKLGLDFLILSDHNPVGERARPQSGWRGDLLLIVGEEISTYDGHILAVGLPAHRYQLAPGTRGAVADIEDLGGWGWIAHPLHPDETWSTGWATLVGVEVVNLAASWARAPTGLRLAVAAAYPFDSDYALLRLLSPGLPGLQLWDSRTSLTPRDDSRWPRPLVGIGAADAHGPIAWPLPVPSYAAAMSAVQTIVWLDVPPDSRDVDTEAKVLGALRGGRAAAVIAASGDAAGFAFEARATSAAPVASMGEMAPWEQGPWTLRASMDVAGDIRIVCLRDGEPVQSVSGSELEYSPDQPGTYRIEVYRLDGPQAAPDGGVPWVISNPIYLWPVEARRAAVLHRVPPLPAPSAGPRLHESRRWRVEYSENVTSELGSSGEHLIWRFKLPPDAIDDTYAALAWRPREARNWGHTDGLVLRLGTAQEMRLTVELRTESEDGDTVAWHHSVKVNDQQRPLVLPWTQWRRRLADPRSGSRLRSGYGLEAFSDIGLTREDLRRVTSLFFIATPEILEPGSSEEVRILELGVYGRR